MAEAAASHRSSRQRNQLTAEPPPHSFSGEAGIFVSRVLYDEATTQRDSAPRSRMVVIGHWE